MMLQQTIVALTGIILLLGAGIRADSGELIFEPGIEYANPDNQHLQLNLARPKNAEGKLPAVVCIHGGGFRAGDRKRWDGLCKKLAERGYVAIAVTYRLAPKYQFPAAVNDVKAAVRWLRANAEKYQVDPERVAALGDSAGGHLAQFLGVTGDIAQFEGDGGNGGQSSRVACVVNYYGPSDFTKSYGKSVDAAEVLPLFSAAISSTSGIGTLWPARLIGSHLEPPRSSSCTVRKINTWLTNRRSGCATACEPATSRPNW
jgi:acetyl esterase/lipase